MSQPQSNIDLLKQLLAAEEENERLRQENAELREGKEAALPMVLNASQVAKVLGVARPTAYAIMQRFDFPSFPLGDGEKTNIRVMRDDLFAWMENRKRSRLPQAN